MLESSHERLLRVLRDDDVVLDIGGWAEPFNRADWVMDLMPYESRGLYERKGWRERSDTSPERFGPRTWVQRDVCAHDPYPFGDKQIDFVICSQTLEDVRDPVWVCSEMNRIAKAGYIEVPSRLEEQSWGIQGELVGWPHHRWLVDLDAQRSRIEFVFKDHGIHSRPTDYFPAGFHETLTPEERVQTLWWEGGFDYRERVFVDEAPGDSYLPDFVARVMAERGGPARRRGARVRRLIGRGLGG